ncbi:PD-(D/E)XK nuclease family protein [Nocardioides zeae]|uniref:PD-(D/E)XK nuclease family protein n=1 Tax=Nocardioides imazamoxiresistens TaxID=3231893 RepID=A0ABU3PSW1_9ACTN|nr:PD-(D/E)XK nuclease family protein [Nocardioides zeae]MDT9592313.1 PD-(D/E)XK nuclease family protein [Nocardioides zeae]
MDSPADALTSIAADADVVGSLSPSRAGDFLTCPLLYRFRHVDRLPEQPSLDAVRGTVVHRALELLFDEPAAERTPERARDLLGPAWSQVGEAEPAVLALLSPHAADGPTEEAWLEQCGRVVDRYFTLEDPRRLEPAERELYVETVTGSRLVLRGIVDRLDVAPDGRVRVVDYKTGRSPGVGFEARALFQMRFYALVLLRSRGVLPAALQLMYLGNGEIITDRPDERDLLALERKVEAIWQAISEARTSGDWQPRPSKLCGWCAHQALCPAYGGTPPPFPPVLPVPPVPPQAPAATGSVLATIDPASISST